MSGVGRTMYPPRTIVMPLLLVACLWPVAAFAKRAAPKRVPPLVYNGVEYRARDACFVEATDVTSGKKLWRTKVYQVWIIPLLEEDVQWVFISDMQVQGDKLLVKNELGKNFRLDLKSGRIDGAMRYWVPWFVGGVLVAATAFFAWARTRRGKQSEVKVC
jgi:hypothetical protein